MGIDFTAAQNANSYSGRQAHDSWVQAIRSVIDPLGKKVVDLGCGGGIYSREWLAIGARSVIGVDSSAPILEAAGRDTDDARASFLLGDASATGLPGGLADIVFSRALVHHLEDLTAFAQEAVRLVRPGGSIIIQDRTMDDVAQPADPRHLRGYFFELFPRLFEVERTRRPEETEMAEALQVAANAEVDVRRLWEVRTMHESRQHVLADIGARKGRSILHDLDGDELEALVGHIAGRLPDGHIWEMDSWTLWIAHV